MRFAIRMKLAGEQEIADRALARLKELRGATNATVVEELTLLFHEMGNDRTDEHERAEAWLAVGRLVRDPTTTALWDNAIAKTQAWVAAR
jgi:hypothetical protein